MTLMKLSFSQLWKLNKLIQSFIFKWRVILGYLKSFYWNIFILIVGNQRLDLNIWEGIYINMFLMLHIFD